MIRKITFFLLLVVNIPLTAQPIPAWFTADLERMVGKWVTDNAHYQSEQEPFEQYVMEWSWAANKKAISGQMYGLAEGKRSGDFWEFRQYWDFQKKEGMVVQYGWNGTMGIGGMRSLGGYKTELLQVFTTPEGKSSSQGHRSDWRGDTLITSSFQVDEKGQWSPDRSYAWRKSEEKPSLLKSPSSYYPKEKAQVLVVGTFHFHYPDLDLIKSKENDRIDVLKEPKKSEVTKLVNYIKRFKPNKIAIEALPIWEATDRLKKYKTGAYRDQRDERIQIAFRLADELGLDTLYSIDTRSVRKEVEKASPSFIAKTFEAYDLRSEDPYINMMFQWRKAEEAAIGQVDLLEYFRFINSRDYHQNTLGVYLLGDFKLDNLRGADALTLSWYNRNLRIFRKLQQVSEGPQDRILVLYGNGHATILRQLLEASPEYEFVEFDGL